MNIKPLGDRLVVEPKEKETTTASGLVLPDTASEKPQQGTVLAIGPGLRDDAGKRIALDVLRPLRFERVGVLSTQVLNEY
jgi:chaperonin GroES